MIKKAIKEKIKEYFLLNPTEKLRVRHIEKVTKTTIPMAIRYSKELEEEEILKKLTIANVTIYCANRSSKHFLLEKKLFNIKSLHKSELIKFLINELGNPSIIVFGSYSKGEDIENSDIDLYIQTPSKKEINLEKFEKKLQRKIQLFVYKDITNIKNKELTNNIINGILLNGFVRVFK